MVDANENSKPRVAHPLFGVEIREHRKSRLMNQTELAEKSGLGLRTIQRLEKMDRFEGNDGTLEALAKAMELPGWYVGAWRKRGAPLDEVHERDNREKVERVLRRARFLDLDSMFLHRLTGVKYDRVEEIFEKPEIATIEECDAMESAIRMLWVFVLGKRDKKLKLTESHLAGVVNDVEKSLLRIASAVNKAIAGLAGGEQSTPGGTERLKAILSAASAEVDVTIQRVTKPLTIEPEDVDVDEFEMPEDL